MAKWWNPACMVLLVISVLVATLGFNVPLVSALILYGEMFVSLWAGAWLAFWSLRFLVKRFPIKFEWAGVRVVALFILFGTFYSIIMQVGYWFFGKGI